MRRWITVLLLATAGVARMQGVVGAEPTQVIQLSLGFHHSCALTADGQVFCWGRNQEGQLGDGTTHDATEPRPVIGLVRVSRIAAGGNHTCALARDGTVHCWGANHRGQLGSDTAGVCTGQMVSSTGVAVGHSLPCSPVAVPVHELTGVAALAAGGNHSCAALADGSVSCWGDNLFLQLGGQTREPRTRPNPVLGLTGVVELALGDQHSCARTRAGAVLCWGGNTHGQVNDSRIDCGTPALQPTLQHVESIAAGYVHNCALRRGRLRCWGDNTLGQLGAGTLRSSARPRLVAPLGRIAAASLGTAHSCALTRSGAVYCWGDGRSGQLGNGRSESSMRPDVSPSMSGFVQLASGGHHVCACTARTCSCWGANTFGQLGDGTTQNRQRPTPVLLPDRKLP
jgi:alpha-tubulin suppressor-like RCC1 family protein